MLLGLLSCFEAFDATDGLVFSFFAMEAFAAICGLFRDTKDGCMNVTKQEAAHRCAQAAWVALHPMPSATLCWLGDLGDFEDELPEVAAYVLAVAREEFRGK